MTIPDGGIVWPHLSPSDVWGSSAAAQPLPVKTKQGQLPLLVATGCQVNRDAESAQRLGGFCLLIKRAVLKKIEQSSSLRDWTDLKLFDTDLLSNKARQAGFTLALCRDLYIHHFESRIFAHGAPKPEEVNR